MRLQINTIVWSAELIYLQENCKNLNVKQDRIYKNMRGLAVKIARIFLESF